MRRLNWPSKAFLAPVVVCSVVMYSRLSCAQAGIDAGALQQNLQRQLPSPGISNLPEPSAPNAVPEARPGQTVVTVTRFNLEGIENVPADEVQAVLKSWLDRPITFDDLQKACEAIEALYRRRGFIVQAILPPQNIVAGVVIIQVVEARLGEVTVDTPTEVARFDKKRARDFIIAYNELGKPADTESLERSLIILNETPGVNVTSALEAGTKEGETNLRLTLSDTPLLSGRLEANNYGAKSTGVAQATVSAALNSPLGLGDQFLGYGIYAEGSQYSQAAYSAPVGASGLRAGVSASAFSYRNIGEYVLNGGFGGANVYSANLSYPLLRSQGANANLTMQFDNKTYLNKNIQTDAVISNYQINSINFGISGNRYDGFAGGGVTTGSLNLVLGQLSILGSSPESYASYQDSTGQLVRLTPSTYQKLNWSLSRTQTVVPDKTRLLLNTSGQFASSNLNSAEQFYLGGPYGVRAYPVAQGGGSQGMLATLELQHEVFQGLLLTAFYDAGVVQQYVNTYSGWQGQTNAGNVYNLMGAGFGVKYALAPFNVSAMVAWKVGNNPLYSQTGLAVNTDNSTTNPRGWLIMGVQF
jgi:hemolysin activation/secretion protein